MITFDQMHSECNSAGQPCSYWGSYGGWLVVLGQSRDSDVLERSNFDSTCKMLDDISPECYEVERETHWTVGWVETLLVDPDNTDAVEMAESIRDRLEDYPIVDEEHYSAMECHEFEESWDCWARSNYQQALADSYGEKGHVVIEAAIHELDSNAIDELASVARDHVNWLYQPDGSGVTVNVEGLVEETSEAELIQAVMANRPRRTVTLRMVESWPYDPKQKSLFEL